MMIAKKDLIDGAVYSGHCRNASEALWDAARNVFVYRRRKFGDEFNEDICHPDDDSVYDVFVPESLNARQVNAASASDADAPQVKHACGPDGPGVKPEGSGSSCNPHAATTTQHEAADTDSRINPPPSATAYKAESQHVACYAGLEPHEPYLSRRALLYCRKCHARIDTTQQDTHVCGYNTACDSECSRPKETYPSIQWVKNDHRARKRTWLYVVGVDLSIPVDTSPTPPKKYEHLPPEKRARAIKTGECQRMSHRQRKMTPKPFRDLLIELATSVSRRKTSE